MSREREPDEAALEIRTAALPLVRLALAEDFGAAGDVTSNAIVPPTATAAARLVARKAGVLAGLEVARLVFEQVNPDIIFESHLSDGARLAPDQVVAVLSGPARGLLAGERTALNFIQRLCGIATQTAQYVEALRGTGVRVVDTRKTTPGYRRLEKAAVRAGGGGNHRIGLYDRILIKDNHEAVAGSVAEAIRRARLAWPTGIEIEVEVRTLAQLEEALAERPDSLLLDNMAPHVVAECAARVARQSPRPRVEVSGGVTLETIRQYAVPGVDEISVGALTHSAPALDLALDFEGIIP